MSERKDQAISVPASDPGGGHGVLARARRPRLRTLPKCDIAALLLLAVLTLTFFWQIALTNRVLAGLDLFAYFYPYRDFASEALRAGRLPLWNPYLFMGAPLLANSQAAVLYPLHWPLLWLSPPKQVAWSIVLHVWLAGAGTYLFVGRALKLKPLAALTASVVFALGGFIGAQVEHLNQLNASAWLPWLFLCIERATRSGQQKWLSALGGAVVVGLALLAGHTQAAYIVLVAAAVYSALLGFRDFRERGWWSGLQALTVLAVIILAGAALAAGQLLPTLELSGLSVRGGGLPYNEAASFSLKPGLIFKAFLPPLAWEPPFSEYVAYLGLIGLALAVLGTWATLKRKRPGVEALILATMGVFLAFGAYNPVYYLLYRFFPGFDLFRVPARWLLAYSFGAAILAGVGLDVLPALAARKPRTEGASHPNRKGGIIAASLRFVGRLLRQHRLLSTGIILLMVIELFVTGRQLAYNRPTAPTAFDSMRTAPAHLLADDSADPFRFLSMSDIQYDPGDLGDLQAMYNSHLPESAVYDLIVATKMKEVLAFNLPLQYRLYSVDGYDGGLLPIKDYVILEQLFLTEDEIWPDGRLRQQLRQVPSATLLALLNVKYVITDKTQDVWIDDIYYDLEHTMPLGEIVLDELPLFETTHLGIVSYLTGTAGLENGTPVAQVTVSDSEGVEVTTTLRAGEHTAEGLYAVGAIAHSEARVGHRWRDNEQGSDYITILDLERVVQPTTVALRSLVGEGRVLLRGLTLIDADTGTSRTVSVDPAYRLVHSGDVKIYQNLTTLPRAFIVHRAQIQDSAEAALTLLRDPSFNPRQEVVLAEGQALEARGGHSTVEIVTYSPEEIHLQANLDAPGYLVLTDTHFPGWAAEVDGEAVPIYRADLYFRAVELGIGDHQIAFQYRPASVRAGLVVSLASWLAMGLAIAVLTRRIGRRMPSSV